MIGKVKKNIIKSLLVLRLQTCNSNSYMLIFICLFIEKGRMYTVKEFRFYKFGPVTEPVLQPEIRFHRQTRDFYLNDKSCIRILLQDSLVCWHSNYTSSSQNLLALSHRTSANFEDCMMNHCSV